MCGHAFLLLWGIYLRVEFLGHMIILCFMRNRQTLIQGFGALTLWWARGWVLCLRGVTLPHNGSVRWVTVTILIS